MSLRGLWVPCPMATQTQGFHVPNVSPLSAGPSNLPLPEGGSAQRDALAKPPVFEDGKAQRGRD